MMFERGIMNLHYFNHISNAEAHSSAFWESGLLAAASFLNEMLILQM